MESDGVPPWALKLQQTFQLEQFSDKTYPQVFRTLNEKTIRDINDYLVQQLIACNSTHLDQAKEESAKLKAQIDSLKKLNDTETLFRIAFDPAWKPTKENKGVDDKTIYFTSRLLNLMLLQSDNSQLLYNILEHLDAFLLKATTLHQKFYWLRQFAYIIESIETQFPDAIPTYANKSLHIIGNDGIYIGELESCGSQALQLFVFQLYAILLNVYSVILDELYIRVSNSLVSVFLSPIQQDPDEKGIFSLSMPIGYENADAKIILNYLKEFLNLFTSWFVQDAIIIQFFNQIYHFIDVSFFEHLMKTLDQNCSTDRGMILKFLISEFQDWKIRNLKVLSLPNGLTITQLCGMEILKDCSNLLVLDKSNFLSAEEICSFFPSLEKQAIEKILISLKSKNVSIPDVILRSNYWNS